MDITTETLQGWLEDAWDAAKPNANTLRDQFRAYESSARAKTNAGSFSTVSKANSSVGYRGPGIGSYTLVQIADGWRMLINLFDELGCWFDWAVLNPPLVPPVWWPTAQTDRDTFIYAGMKKRLVVIYDCQVDLIDLYLSITNPPQGVLTW